MCGVGAGSLAPAAVARRGGRKRTNVAASTGERLSGVSQRVLRVGGQIARENHGFALAVESFAGHHFTGHGDAGDAGQRFAALADFRFAGGAQCRQRHDANVAAGTGDAFCGALGKRHQDRFQPVVTEAADVIGLGGGEENAVDAARIQT